MAATVHDVARLAGVSSETVSNVVDDTAKFRDATRDRVQRAIRELCYRPDLSPRRLRSVGAGCWPRSPRAEPAVLAELADEVIRAAERHRAPRGAGHDDP